jgi:hypothetical protein
MPISGIGSSLRRRIRSAATGEPLSFYTVRTPAPLAGVFT